MLKFNQKGFSPVFIILIIVVLAAGGFIFWRVSQVEEPASGDSSNSTKEANKPKTITIEAVENIHGEEIWTVADSDEIVLDEWDLKMQVSERLASKMAYIYDDPNDTYEFSTIDLISNEKCREAYAVNGRPSLQVRKYELDQQAEGIIEGTDKSETINDFYENHKVNGTNYAQDPGGDPQRRWYKFNNFFVIGFYHTEASVERYLPGYIEACGNDIDINTTFDGLLDGVSEL